MASPYEDISGRVYIGTIVTIVPATIVVFLRYFARHIARAGFWWDDYTIAAALILNWTMAALRWHQVSKFGLGLHADQLPAEQIKAFGKSFLASQIVYFINAAFTKSSLLLLYYRIFGVVKGFRWALWIVGSLVLSYFVVCVIVSITECSPIAKFWDPTLPGTCINEIAFFRWNGAGNMILDVVVLCLPYPMAWRLQVTLRQKLILTGIFLLGGFVCVISVLRITSFNFLSLEDRTFVSVEPSTWSSIEQSVGIVCACLPTLRPLLRWVIGSSREKSRKRDSGESDFPKRSPLSGRISGGDEEIALESPESTSAPRQSFDLRVPSSPELNAVQNKSRASLAPEEVPRSAVSQIFDGGDAEGHMPRPESFA